MTTIVVLTMQKIIVTEMASAADEKRMIREATQAWSEQTCVHFSEHDTDTTISEPHLVFTASSRDGYVLLQPITRNQLIVNPDTGKMLFPKETQIESIFSTQES